MFAGNVISFCLFLSPMPTFIQIVKRKSVQEYRQDPYVATVLNCMMRVFYGLVHPDSILIVTINGIGVAIEIIYVLIFMLYSPWSMWRKIITAIIVEVLVIVFTLSLVHTTKARSNLVVVLCIIFNIMMYASPLTIMKKVIATKSVMYMPFALSLANFCNGLIWAAYALLKFDTYILVKYLACEIDQIPNAMGALSGLGQLILYATYYRTTNWDDKSSEIELSEA